MIIAFAALACSTEVEDADQKKRGTAKGNNLNAIPSGAQKQDYTYSIYSQNPSSQSGASSPLYQSQVPNSFYPNQGSQYYTSSNTPTETSPQYAQQPQINLLPPSSSQFVPINFVPNPGYQSKYQLVPSQGKGNIQLAVLQQPNSYPTPSVYPSSFPQTLFAPNPTNQLGHHQNFLGSLQSPSQFNVAPSLPYSIGNSYLGQPSAMVLLAQPHPLYNNFYNNPGQSLYNYFASNNQPRYGLSYAPQSSDVQVSALQNIPKEENEISGANSSEYTSAPSDTSAAYKNSYTSSRSSYLKI